MASASEVVESVSQSNGFILGLDLSHSTDSFVESPVKSRFSNPLRNTRQSARKSTRFSNVRNRSYTLAASPQKQPPVSRLGRRPRSHNLFDDRNSGGGGTSARSSASTRNGVKKGGPPKRKVTSIKSPRNKISDEDSKNAHFKVLMVSSKWWTPISKEAKSVLLESMSSSSAIMTAMRKRDGFISKVTHELDTATAPASWRQKSYSNLKNKKEALESKLSGLVRWNADVEKKLDGLESQAIDQLGKVKEISGSNEEESAVSRKTSVRHNKDWTSESEGAFGDYLRDLAESSRQSLMR